MTKQKISSKVVRARSLAIYELEQFINYVRTIAPGLEPDQTIVLTAFILDGLPELFQQNPVLLDQIKDIATNMKLKRRVPNTTNDKSNSN
ncbi:hypothetical protein A6769_22025 [Nostoc punctiforme NIES-2108]|uniref:Uncharacterized protein n=1 Tax=Nostoc punctiforme NIES-2108 TaxID=1356359 RepID=A0A367REX1_NOSPU|nr:hypothetical protein A6769_22025 [Nostoc punctiforme NIES-2108]